MGSQLRPVVMARFFLLFILVGINILLIVEGKLSNKNIEKISNHVANHETGNKGRNIRSAEIKKKLNRVKRRKNKRGEKIKGKKKAGIKKKISKKTSLKEQKRKSKFNQSKVRKAK